MWNRYGMWWALSNTSTNTKVATVCFLLWLVHVIGCVPPGFGSRHGCTSSFSAKKNCGCGSPHPAVARQECFFFFFLALNSVCISKLVVHRQWEIFSITTAWETTTSPRRKSRRWHNVNPGWSSESVSSWQMNVSLLRSVFYLLSKCFILKLEM